MQEQPSEEFFKKGVMRNSQNSQEKICNGISFWCCKFCEICKNTVLAEQLRTTASHYNSINSSEGSTGKLNCEL